ncbi:hypothetical protein IPA_03645 [Ignicoccus pacificus DSM 13166]|uniref:Uncharacterized protein n=1 Tax=Ignicoccus pacificus DSM 13166 TaxID=940294 RepID=A0A977PK11_9CREN|nr:hypothetical protein IPA_03645 [Ignicoccus pacificus DSM 13166]
MSVKDVIDEIKNYMKTFEELKKELEERRDKLKRELTSLMKKAEEMKILERVCVRIGRSCSIEACYVGIRVSRGVMVLDEGAPKLYLIDGCNVSIVDPDTSDMYEALLRLRDLTAQAVKQLSELLENL